MRIELGLSPSDGTNFDAYYIKSEDVEFEKRLHSLLNRGYAETNVGYRRVFEIDLFPFNDDKSKLYNLYYWMTSNEKWIAWYTNSSGHTVEPTFTSDVLDAGFTRNTCKVVYYDNSIGFNHSDSSFFLNNIKLKCYESGLNQISDTGVTRTLKPSYDKSGLGISGNTFTCFVNLVDQSSAEVAKTQMKFVNGNYGSRDFGYLHTLTIDFGAITTLAQREWLRDFCLWGSKNIDTTGIDSYNGRVFDVVLDGSALNWSLINGLSEAKGTTLTFKEKTLRRTIENYIEPPSSKHQFQLDVDALDDSNTYLG